MKLMIVESPNKVKKIQSYMTDDWVVAASVGHIRDLPEKEMGISSPEFKPTYVISKNKTNVVSKLKALVSKADEVFLATDADREGESIAYHLKECLNLKNPKRVLLREITKTAINNAITNAGEIDHAWVEAQEARRVVDRIVGYHVSPILSVGAGMALSAGRVQSPSLWLAVQREREIKLFTKRSFYGVEIVCKNDLKANLDPAAWCDDGKHIFDIDLANAILNNVKSVNVESVNITDKESKPRPPFITSTLQQKGSTVLKFSATKTMDTAQSLFAAGLVTYHRTDSPNLSKEGFDIVVSYLKENDIDAQEIQIIRKSKDSAQEAHEAIRPTDISLAEAGSTEDEIKLYALIRERTLSSAMKPAIDTVTTIIFKSNDIISVGEFSGQPIFKADGKVLKYEGWRSICNIEKPEKNKNETTLPLVPGINETYSITTNLINKSTEPPARYSEASLIAALEKHGIGRPSTYASIINNITKRKYIKIIKEKIHTDELADTLITSLEPMSFIGLKYTRDMEEQLDDIAAGKSKYLDIVSSTYETTITESKAISIRSFLKIEPCPKCGEQVKQLPSKIKSGNPFWVHVENQQNCEKYLLDINDKPVVKVACKYVTDTCSNCQNEIRRIEKNNSAFWVHSKDENAKECLKYIRDVDGKALYEKETLVDCPYCQKKIVRKYSDKNNSYFWVHKTSTHAKTCKKFISDSDGSPK